MKPPYCRVCHRPHWNNQPHLGSPSDWSRENAEARGIDVSGPGAVTATPHAGDGLTVLSDDSAKLRLIEFLKANPGAEQATIKKGVRARWQDVRHALTELLKLGALHKAGKGTRNDGFRYSVRDGDGARSR